MRKLFTFFAALTLSVGLAQAGCVFTYTATEKLEDQFDELGWVESHDFNNGEGTVTYYEEITAIGGFYGCTALQSINLPTCVTEIGYEAFNGCSNLQSINLSNVTMIGGSAFYGCTSLQSIDMLNITTIGETAFNDCVSLQSITLPATLTTIEMLAFCGCTGVTSVTFLGTSCTIGEDAFGYVGFTTPAALTLPAGWTGTLPDKDGYWYSGKFKVDAPAPKVGDTFVDATSGLKFEVTAVGETNTVKVINNTYSGTSYTVPATVKYKEVDFAVTEIGEWAFSYTTLQSVTFPVTLTMIGSSAFYYCIYLTSVTFEGNACQIGGRAFFNVGETTPAALTLPTNWTGTLPDEEGNWYEGKFELVSGPTTALPTLFGEGVKGNKFMHNGQLIIRSGNKKYNVLGF